MKRTSWKVLAAVLVATAGLARGGSALGEQVTYYVDPARSSLTLSGNWEGYDLVGNLTTFYTGTINGNRDVGANTLQLISGNVTAQNIGSTPANYIFQPAPHADEGAEYFAIQGFAFSISSPEITSISSFNASQLSMVIESGEFDYLMLAHRGSVPLSGNLSLAPSNATLRSMDGIETLTLPIDTDLTVVFYPFGVYPDSVAMHFSGTLIAVSPEPGSLACLLLPTMLLLRRPRTCSR